jgi:hypothetical protein
MNRKQITITIDVGSTEHPASEGHEAAELAAHSDALQAVVAAIPGAVLVDVQLEIVEAQPA